MKKAHREILRTFILAAVIFFVLQATIQSSIVVGCSMEPGLQNGERILISKVVYKLHEPERGDVIVFYPPEYPREQKVEYVKRIIALPGEYVEIKDSKVYIYQNNEVLILDELSYIKEPPNNSFTKQMVLENTYFVLGDNRNNSNDSRKFGMVSREDIIGKAWLSIWPPQEWGAIQNHSLPQS